MRVTKNSDTTEQLNNKPQYSDILDSLARPITQSEKLDETICELCVVYVCAIPTNEKT